MSNIMLGTLDEDMFPSSEYVVVTTTDTTLSVRSGIRELCGRRGSRVVLVRLQEQEPWLIVQVAHEKITA
jgi:hypothetical protein